MNTLNKAGTFTALGGAVYALARIGTGLLFMQHGAQKLFGLLGGTDGAGTTVPLISQMGLAGILEFFGGFLIVFGLLTRPVAFVLLVEMIVAYVIAHMPEGGFPVQNGGELALLYALVFAIFAANGAGPTSIDRHLQRRRLEADTARRQTTSSGDSAGVSEEVVEASLH